MLKLAVLHHKKFKVSDLELKRKGISYTVDTLREIGLQWPKTALYLVLGSDNLKFLPSWKEPEEILGLAKVVLVERPKARLSRTKIWVNRAVVIKAPHLEVSSSQIREKVRRKEKISFWVPERVEKYIEKHRLYKR
jgi:nicotinate-nucleotide adenylyltransferase